ncbi:hypothetical protein VC83_00154 [Pseudogymnoascus destructans]|uniref:Uncharacterized protein n=1 Tax=Pseudogymnoascus destructans TaxID=655981 RepID=A0A177AMT6_9PEZI|nr:uncharacterized protein VC83_00154 [Pseudogymnoascus destructans]OAF63366.1 hypothetical protein VC83_00154 [Pseudogymnoascus destructans]
MADWESDQNHTEHHPHSRANVTKYMEQFSLLETYDLLKRDAFFEVVHKTTNGKAPKALTFSELVKADDYFPTFSKLPAPDVRGGPPMWTTSGCNNLFVPSV